MPDLSSLSSLLPQREASQDNTQSITQLRLRDYTEKLDSRRSMKWILISLLLVQNFAVYSLVAWALINGKLADLQVVLGIVISATLGETYLMVKIMIEWLFKDIDYK
jgi:hypothetical protein